MTAPHQAGRRADTAQRPARRGPDLPQSGLAQASRATQLGAAHAWGVLCQEHHSYRPEMGVLHHLP
jgi:hypothetical protein